METGKSTVDLIILSYGDYEGLPHTIRSILEQTQEIGTVLLSDDGSGVPFPEDCVALLRRGKFRVLIRQGDSNIGTVAHINEAAKMLCSRFIKIVSAGDAFSDQDALKTLVDFACCEDSLLVTSDSTVCSADLSKQYYHFPGFRRRYFRHQGRALFNHLAIANFISAQGTLFQRAFFTDYGGIDEDYYLLEDWPTWLRLVREGHRIPFLPRVTALYSIGGVSSANSNAYRAPKLNADMRRCYEKEIIPFCDQLSHRAKCAVNYRYAELCGTPNSELRKRYPVPYIIDTTKRWLKTCITR